MRGAVRSSIIAALAIAMVAPLQDTGFRFVRVRYQSHPGMRGNAWATDYPTAELNLHEAIDRTTLLQLEGATHRARPDGRAAIFSTIPSST